MRGSPDRELERVRVGGGVRRAGPRVLSDAGGTGRGHGSGFLWDPTISRAGTGTVELAIRPSGPMFSSLPFPVSGKQV